MFRDTLVVLERPAVTDTVELSLETHVKHPTDTPSSTVNSDTCVLKGKGKSGIEVVIAKKKNKAVAIVSVPADSLRKNVAVEGTKRVTAVRHLSWIEQMLDDVPCWAIITAMALAVGFLIYALRR